MLDKIYSIYEAGIKYVLIAIPVILFIVMAYLYIKSS
jgi:hypothetical protein